MDANIAKYVCKDKVHDNSALYEKPCKCALLKRQKRRFYPAKGYLLQYEGWHIVVQYVANGIPICGLFHLNMPLFVFPKVVIGASVGIRRLFFYTVVPVWP